MNLNSIQPNNKSVKENIDDYIKKVEPNELISKILKQYENKVPIYKGCLNLQCFCNGTCKEIIGWRDKHPLEK